MSATSSLMRLVGRQIKKENSVIGIATLILPHTFPQVVSCRHAGHSHWANIRHIKGAKDEAKGRFIAQLRMKMLVAVREGGGDVKFNNNLARLVKNAEQNSIPSKTINNLIKSAVSSKELAVQTTIEARGPNGSFFIFSVITENLKKTRQEIHKHLAKNCGGSVLDNGATKHYFDEKGVVIAAGKDGAAISLAQAEDIAISVDAEEVEAVTDSESDRNQLRFQCEPLALQQVCKRLSEYDKIEILSSGTAYIPTNPVALSDKDKGDVERAFSHLGDLNIGSVLDVHDNIQ